MRNYEFTLILSGLNDNDEERIDALYEAGCDDALLYFRSNIAYMEFDRVSVNLETAILSAIKDIERVNGLKVESVEPSDLVSMAEISNRVGCTRESVRQWLNGLIPSYKSPPSPYALITKKDPIWSFFTVVSWISKHRYVDPSTIERAETIQKIDFFLRNRNPDSLVAIKSIEEKFESLEK